MLRDEIYEETLWVTERDSESLVKAAVTEGKVRELIRPTVLSGRFEILVSQIVPFFLGPGYSQPLLAEQWICEALRKKFGFDVDEDLEHERCGEIRISWAKGV